MTFAHVSVRTSDMDRSIDFYREYLGMKLIRRREIPQNNAEIAFLGDEGSDFSLELTHYRDQERFEQAEYGSRLFDHLAFLVDDLPKVVERIIDAGFTVTDQPFELSPGRWLAFIEDPDGTLIELIQK
ncbi:MAG: VOC family protein [Thermoplasmatota archaeon]